MSRTGRIPAEEDLRGASAFGSHWRRWRRALLGRSSSAPSAASLQTLGDFVKNFQMQDVHQVGIPVRLSAIRYPRINLQY